MKEKGRNRIIQLTGCLLLVAMISGSIGYHMLHAKTNETKDTQSEVSTETEDTSTDLTGDGTTQIATISQLADFDVTVSDLVVEEVYVSAGDTVKEGDPLLKLTDESMEAIHSYYEQAVADAKEDLTDAQTSYEVGKLEAEYTLESTKTTAEYADANYAAAIAELDQKVADAQTALSDAQSQIAEYQTALDNNTYYTDNQVDEKKQAAADAKTAADNVQQTYNDAKQDYEDLQKTVAEEIAALSEENLTEQAKQLADDYETLSKAKEDADQAASALTQAQNEQKTKEEESSQAQSQYEKQVEEATSQKEQLESSLTKLQSDYEEACRDAVTKKVEAQNTCDTAELNGTYADSTYENTVHTLESTVDTAQKAYDELMAEQQAVGSIEDGVITAAQDGTVAAVGYEAEDTLATATAIVSYYDTATILIPVQVDQSHMEDIAVGDSVTVEITGVPGNHKLAGTIQTIATQADTTTGASKVVYETVIAVDNSDGTISTGLSAKVTFLSEESEDNNEDQKE